VIQKSPTILICFTPSPFQHEYIAKHFRLDSLWPPYTWCAWVFFVQTEVDELLDFKNELSCLSYCCWRSLNMCLTFHCCSILLSFVFVCLVFPLHSSGWVSCFSCSWIWWQNWNLENRIWLSLHSFQVDFSCMYQGVLSIYEDINTCLRPLILGVIFLCNCLVSVEVWIYSLFKEYS